MTSSSRCSLFRTRSIDNLFGHNPGSEHTVDSSISSQTLLFRKDNSCFGLVLSYANHSILIAFPTGNHSLTNALRAVSLVITIFSIPSREAHQQISSQTLLSTIFNYCNVSTVLEPEAYASKDSKEELKDAPLVKEARIVSLAFPGDPNNAPVEASDSSSELPEGAKLLQIGGTVDDLDLDALKAEEANVAFVSPGVTGETLAAVIEAVPSIEWIQSRSAGIDTYMSKTLEESSDDLVMTNAKGAFSSTLAEYTMMACGYFAKDFPRLMKNKNDGKWEKYCVLELRGATLGVVGYGDIGRAAAKLAKAYGMKVIALRKNVPSQEAIDADPCCDVVYGSDSLNQLFSESDYVLCAAPLTAETHCMIGKEQFDSAKEGCVFINVGRGPIVDEPALVEALKDGRLKGAGLDVFTKEPLEEDSELWTLDNVLLSPHNMDMTDTFMLESTQFFVRENLPRFLRGQSLLNPVDKKAGY